MNDSQKQSNQAQKFTNMINSLNILLEQEPNSIDILNQLAEIYESYNKLEQAISYYDRILSLTPNNNRIQLKLASLKIRQGEFSSALKYFQQVLKIDENQPAWVFIGLGDALNNVGSVNEAILAFRKAITLKPDYGLIYAKLANVLDKNNENHEIINLYQKALELQSELPLWAYINYAKILKINDLCAEIVDISQYALSIYQNNISLMIFLAEAQGKLGFTHEAISNYQKICSLEPQQSSWLYQNLGNLLFSVGQEKLAIESYMKSIDINYQFFGNYARLDTLANNLYGTNHSNILNGLSQVIDNISAQDKSIISNLERYLNLGFLGNKGKTIDPLSYYFINHNLKLVYCGIPKNACTLFKKIIVEHSKNKVIFEKSNKNIHQFLVENRCEISTFLSSLESPDYYKMIILRNPFSRLASGYLDKFAKHPYPESFAVEVIKSVQEFLNLDLDIEKSITFDQFIKYLSRKEDYELNDHWQPQNIFVGSIKFDLIGQFENLSYVLDVLEKKYSIQIPRKGAEHATNYQDFSEEKPFHTMYPGELRKLAGMPKAKQLYSAELESIVRSRYAEDIMLYEQYFQVSLNDLRNCL